MLRKLLDKLKRSKPREQRREEFVNRLLSIPDYSIPAGQLREMDDDAFARFFENVTGFEANLEIDEDMS